MTTFFPLKHPHSTVKNNTGEEAIQVVRKILKERGWVDIPSVGYSMYPFIRERDVCRFRAIDLNRDDIDVDVDGDFCKISRRGTLTRGNVLLFVSRRGSLTGHRLSHLTMVDGSPQLVMKGDTNRLPDHPVPLQDVLGHLVGIRRNERWINPNTRGSRLWARLLLEVPFVTLVIRRFLEYKYRLVHKLKLRPKGRVI